MFDFNDREAWGYHVLQAANIPARFRGLEWTDLSPYAHDPDAEARVWVREMLSGTADPSNVGRGLLYVGKPGHGKTTLALTVAQALCRGWPSQDEARPVGRPVYYVSYPELLETAKRKFGSETAPDEDRLLAAVWGTLEPENNVQVLILDDLGREHRTASGWAENYFDNLIRIRFDKGLATVVTSNVPRNQWGEVYGERMASFAYEAFDYYVIVSPEGDRRR